MSKDLFQVLLDLDNQDAKAEFERLKRKPRGKQMELPKVDNYHFQTQRDSVRAVRVDIGDITIWFSYRTCIAFRVPGHPTVCRENDWKNTTGGHMRSVGVDKEDRVSAEAFHRLWNKLAVPALAGRKPRAPRKPKPPRPKTHPKLMESMEFRRKVTPSIVPVTV